MPRISNVAAIAALNAITGLVNNGNIKVFTGAAPSNCEAADTGTLLGTLTLAATAFPGASDGTNLAQTVANAIGDDVDADADGAPGYFRIYTSGNVCVLQGTAGGPTGGPFELTFDKDSFVTGDTVQITSLTLRMPEA